MIVSRESPEPPDAFGCIASTSNSRSIVYDCFVVISAFSWRLKASGSGFSGRVSM